MVDFVKLRISRKKVVLVKPMWLGYCASSLFNTNLLWIPMVGYGLLVVIRSLVVYSACSGVEEGESP